jgi:membrane fusion protein (multidrug efflux system)
MPGRDGKPIDAVAPQKRSPDLFRREALENLVRGGAREGEPLRISPAWTRWTYWVLIAFFVMAGLYLLLGRIGEYAEGPAVVKIEGRREITAMTGGTVTSLDVQPGETVGVGQPMVHLEQWTVRAPEAGSVGDIHVRPGQVVAAGDPLLSLRGPASDVSVIAMLPGSYRPLLAPGMVLRLELAGYRYAYETTTIEGIGDEVIGPQAARRYLGSEMADTVPLAGPVVVVRARLRSRTFMTDQRVHDLYDGMPGRAEVRVRSQRLLVLLVPSLRALFEDRRG